MSNMVCGWGINDVDYPITSTKELPKISGKRRQSVIWVSPYYKDWCNMIYRVYCPELHKKNPTYINCTICEDWKYLSNFIKWVDSQPNRDWERCQPDKDILVYGNKHYGPETVVYISKKLNGFIIDSGKSRGDYMLGVSIEVKSKKNSYIANCRNPFTSKGNYIGTFPTELAAHKAWQAKKHEYACMWADLQQDHRVVKVLKERYAPDKDWTNK